MTWFDASDANYNSYSQVTVGSNDANKALLRFDLGSLPAQAVIDTATLGLYYTSKSNGNSLTVGVHPVLQPWVDSQATWTLRQTGATWATPGMGSGTDYAAAATASVALPASAGQWLSLDVTGAVQGWVSGPAANYGFVLRQQAAGGFVSAKFCTEIATYPCNTGSWKPTLTITYHLGGSGAPPQGDSPTALTAPNAPTATASITKYYHFAGQRVAVRRDGMLYYLFGDHLGSTSLVTDENGVVQWRASYTPYGETRAGAGSPPTDRRFTGQRAESGLGSLYDYKARRYSPYQYRPYSLLDADLYYTVAPSFGAWLELLASSSGWRGFGEFAFPL